ncbi:DUF3298 and DUF4163 domain-containing protein [Subsaxibacter sp. CAU 1640]|uniref:DUF3298 and DUF4163 domain-containing protein n=1 Tax=Subsaxibacter sp. CAU 1640 TaxID=2933271 RepID=UPI002005911D|nr:DUF3298 and DUF4163 domain-containing protein [Subsaxibacter sp. CAU 1640]MCK7589691.1 DUF3298 and DUF4163 domain-containing protein [Subsaxibacter sp. CAU 1640]
MFNKVAIILNKTYLLIIVFLIIFSCKKDAPLSFTDEAIETSDQALITINYPKAVGNEAVADRVNKTLENFLANEINMSEKQDANLSLSDAIKGFEKEYETFKEDFSDTTQQWEALIESEVNYETESIVCVVVNSYIDTGGAHGNSHVTFLNFDKTTGNLLENDEIIKDEELFKQVAKPYFEKVTKPLTDEESEQDLFFGEDFQLPENIGFNENGVILLYNVYEIASYVQGVTEFTIPYDEAKQFLKIDLE